MIVFIDIGHPAHVHYFRFLIGELQGRGHQVVLSARDKEMTYQLLDGLELPYIERGPGRQGLLGKALYLVECESKLLLHTVRRRPDLFLSFGSPYAAHVASILRRPHIALDDTENASLGQALYVPFSEAVLSPDCFEEDLGRNHFKFPGYMELCYLHPNRFKADLQTIACHGIDTDERYAVLRFVARTAAHDHGQRGISTHTKLNAVAEISRHAKVYISSESPLPMELEPFRLRIPPECIHSLIAGASLVYGESATMASEAAVLGTPAIFVDAEGRGYTREQEARYGLVYNFGETEGGQKASVEKAVEILKEPAGRYDERRWRLLNEKIDVTAFVFWLVDGYPASLDGLRSGEGPCWSSWLGAVEMDMA